MTKPSKEVMKALDDLSRIGQEMKAAGFDDSLEANPLVKANLRIVCAANRHKKGGALVLGARHFDGVMRETMSRMRMLPLNKYWEEGFIDNRGQFRTRTEAWRIAVAAGQVIRRCGGDEKDGGTLYSENLY